MSKKTTNTQYTFTLIFPTEIKSCEVTKLDYKVTGKPKIQPPLKRNKMPATFLVGDTITFTYQKKNPDVQIKSSLLTKFNITSSEKETDEDFTDMFDKPIPITNQYEGSWIFHLLGLYKYKGKRAAYYLDPEFTCGNGS